MSGNLCQWCRGPQHGGGCDREALKETIRVLRLELSAHAKMTDKGVILIQSLVSHRNQKPRVDIQVGEIHTQMDAEAAMDVARNLIEAATAAYSDAFIFNFLTERIGTDEGRASMVIQDFRDYREKLQREFEQDQRERNGD
jgi:hypothetical protein